MSVTLHTLSNFVIVSLGGQHVLSNLHFVAWKVRSEVTPFVIARPEEDANTLGRDASWSFPKVW